MDETTCAHLALECLRLAQSHSNAPQETLAAARQYLAFVLGRGKPDDTPVS